MLKKTLESPLGCKEIQPVHPKGNQSWIFIGRTDNEGETPILWPPGAKNWLIGKDPDAGKDWRQEEKGIIEEEMVSPTQWTWVWVNSGSWWWTGKPGMLQSMGLQRVRCDLATEQQNRHQLLPLPLQDWALLSAEKLKCDFSPKGENQPHWQGWWGGSSLDRSPGPPVGSCLSTVGLL